jgi:hypothetical protein
MTLIEAWKDSLRMLTPERLENLVMETWLTMQAVWWALWTPWFIILVFVAYAVTFAKLPLVSIFFDTLLLSFIFLAALPVPRIKDFDYFMSYLGKCWWGFSKFMLLFLMLFVASIVFMIFGLMVAGFTEKVLGLIKDATYISDIIISCSAWAIGLLLHFAAVVASRIGLVMFFYALMEISIRSALKKSLIFVWYNLPLIVLYELLLSGIKFCSAMIPQKVPFVHGIIMLFTLCLGITLYTKRINADPALYQ